MGFRNPITTAIDPVARQAAAAAQSSASSAQSTATSAAQSASDAATAAANAQITANQAGASANTANSAAAAAQSAANTANSAAAAAQSTANTANSAANNITATQISSGAVTTPKLAANAVTAATIAAGAVTAGKIAANAVTAGTIAAGAVQAGTVAAGAIDGQTITGSTIRTAASGQRVQVDSANGLIGYNSAGAAVTQVSPATGALVATGATITGEIDTGAAGTARVRIYEGADGKGNPMGIVAFEDGISGTTDAQIYGDSYGPSASAGGGLTLDGGSYAGVAAPTLVLQVDQAGLSSAQLTAAQGLLVNGNPAVALSGASSSLSGGTFPTTAVPQIRAGTAVVTTNASGTATVTWPAFAAGLITVLLGLGGSSGNPGDLQPTSYALNGVTFTAHTPAGAVLASATFRINFLAVGW